MRYRILEMKRLGTLGVPSPSQNNPKPRAKRRFLLEPKAALVKRDIALFHQFSKVM
jgi:hypothetical protein